MFAQCMYMSKKQLGQDYLAYILKKDFPFQFFNLPGFQKLEEIILRKNFADPFKIEYF